MSRFFPALAVLLCAALSLPPALSWYAYADESATDQGVVDAYSQEAQEGPDGRGDGARSSGADVDGESAASGSDGFAAGEGHGSDDEASAQAEADIEEDNGGITYFDDASNPPDDSFGGFAEDDYLSGSSDGISPLSTTSTNIAWLLGNVSGGTATTVTVDGVKYGANNATLYWVALKIWQYVYESYKQLIISNGYLKAIDTSSKTVQSYLFAKGHDGNSYSAAYFLSFINKRMEQIGATGGHLDNLLSLIRQQWGYNYGTGNTVVWSANSPAGWLKSLNDNSDTIKGYLFAKAHDGNSYSAAYLLVYINQKLEQVRDYASSINSFSSATRENTNLAQGYLYAVGHDGNSYSAAYFLRYINQKLEQVRDSASSIDSFSSAIRENTNLAQGYLFAKAHDGNSYSAAYLLSFINQKLEQSNTKLDGMSLLLDREFDHVRGLLENSNNLSYGAVHNLLAVDSSIQRLQDSITPWHENWNDFFTIVVEWAKQWDDVRYSAWSESDKLSLFAKLDAISNRLSVMAAKDVVDALVGDLDIPATAAALGCIQDAMGRAFPFCVPSVVNMVLFGSVVADPSPPRWEFDIAGAPLVVDFAPYEGFAEVCRWTVRLLFSASLLLGTRRFVFGMGGAG